MTAKHARPNEPFARIAAQITGRRLAVAAIMLAAGAAPLASAADAQADSSLANGTNAAGTSALPLVNDLPMGLSGLTNPVTQSLPLNSVLPEAQSLPVVGQALPLVSAASGLAQALPLGAVAGLPVDGLPVGQLLPRSAPQPAAANPLAALGALGGGALSPSALASGVLAGTPAAGLLGAAAPAAVGPTAQASLSMVTDSVTGSATGAVGALTSTMPNGGLGGLTAGLTPQTDALTTPLLQQAAPVVSQLQQSGVPTVGGLTNQLSQTSVPMVGTVGHLTQTLPISSVLGTSNPLADTLNSATQL